MKSTLFVSAILLLMCAAKPAYPQTSLIESISPVAIDNDGAVDVSYTLLLSALDMSRIMDFGNTKWALNHGGYELNPVMRYTFQHQPLDMLFSAACISAENVCLKNIWTNNNEAGWIAGSASLIISSFIVYQNFRGSGFNVGFDFSI
ncbi:MAG: DUF5658 family protein [Candidatus Kryptoniota bacterium]